MKVVDTVGAVGNNDSTEDIAADTEPVGRSTEPYIQTSGLKVSVSNIVYTSKNSTHQAAALAEVEF